MKQEFISDKLKTIAEKFENKKNYVLAKKYYILAAKAYDKEKDQFISYLFSDRESKKNQYADICNSNYAEALAEECYKKAKEMAKLLASQPASLERE